MPNKRGKFYNVTLWRVKDFLSTNYWGVDEVSNPETFVSKDMLKIINTIEKMKTSCPVSVLVFFFYISVVSRIKFICQLLTDS